MKHLLFFARHNNDLDQTAPVIYKCLTSGLPWKVTIVVGWPETRASPIFRLNLLDDFRIRFLKEQGAEVVGIVEAFASAQEQADLLELYEKGRSNHPLRALYKKRRKTLARRIEKGLAALDGQAALERLGPERPDFIVSAFGDLFFGLVPHAMDIGIPVVGMPHGPLMPDNIRISPAQMATWEFKPLPRRPGRRFLFANTYEADVYARSGRADREQCLALGSPRYCMEWLPVLDAITPQVELPEAPGKLRVCTMHARKIPDFFNEEIVGVVRFLASCPDVELIAKTHPRGDDFQKDLAGHARLCGIDTPSLRLTQWADVVVFHQSSIIFDALLMDKPLLWLARVENQRMIFERFTRAWNVESRDDLYDRINALIADRNHRTYPPEDRERLIRELIAPKGEDVLSHYVDFFQDAMH